MASMTQVELDNLGVTKEKVDAALAKAVELQGLVRSSLSIQNVGGTVIANELIGSIEKLTTASEELQNVIDTTTVV